MSASQPNGSDENAATGLCLACGLCCNGVIFGDVRLQAGDDPERLHGLGLPLVISRRQGPLPYGAAGADADSAPLRQCKLPQPCAAFDGRLCRVYADRPKHCRNFECGVLKLLGQGLIQRPAALRLVRAARARAERVRRLLREFGDTDESLPLAARFRRTSRRLEKSDLARPQARLYGDLTLAFHDLSLLLSEAFYPGHNAREL